MVSTFVLISYSSSPFTNHSVTIPSAIGINVTLMIQSFFSSLSRSRYFSLCLPLILLCGLPGRQSPQFGKFSVFSLTKTRSGHLTEIRWSVGISKSQRILCVSFSSTDSDLCIYYLFAWSNLYFLHRFQWINSSTLSCLLLYSLCANFLHSFIM